MFPRYRHTPIFDPERKRCPVCNQWVYSLAGIHPQCAIKRAVALESRSKREAASTVDGSVAVASLGTETAVKTATRYSRACS